tara:strand:- start:1845 stop:2237 length:393 start_codon:yes stop_codon:yes gene_type:complete
MAQKKKTPKKTAKSSKKDKKPLQSLSQTHGKEEKFQATTLDQVWGDTGNTRYGTTDVNEYVRKLEDMNTSDLQTHAHKMGLIPVDDRVTVTKKLISEFKRYISAYRKPNAPAPKSSPVSDEVKKILKEGR